ncbi:hypothetical protein Zmor_016940 [Zophobas morio]|uniref:Uncharacterized protein n=1 Tax=Zophobas morio TaxID=2755281 RepID=A0AA38IBH2_9CUCU|nr:hypothetical protein Zmor_016940 [Zophobas morio]
MWSFIGQKVSYTTWTISGLQTLHLVNMVWMWPRSFNVGCTTSCENPTSSFCAITATIVSLRLKISSSRRCCTTDAHQLLYRHTAWENCTITRFHRPLDDD